MIDLSKKDLSNFLGRAIGCLKLWLALDRWPKSLSYSCPFILGKNPYSSLKCFRFCLKIWPALKKDECPCDTLSIKYVRQVVRKIIEIREKTWNQNIT